MKAIQKFSNEYLESCKKMSNFQKIKFLDDYRRLHLGNKKSKSKLISIKIPEDLLNQFRAMSELEGIKYQTKIKELMKNWLGKGVVS